jgi:hypothetical protein
LCHKTSGDLTDWTSWHGFTEGDEHTKNPRTPSLIDGWSNAKVDGYRKSPKVCSCGVKGTRVGSTNEFPGTPMFMMVLPTLVGSTRLKNNPCKKHQFGYRGGKW